MKNKTLKNLIAFGAFAIFCLGFNLASAATSAVQPYNSSWTIPVTSGSNGYYYQDAYNQNQNYNQNYNNQYNGYNSQQQNTYSQQPYTYVQAQPQVQYVQQPAKTVVKYVPVETIKYVNTGATTNNQAASVARANTTVATNRNTGVTGNTGQYVNYDPNSQGMMLANAYGAYNGQQVQNSQPVYDDNGVAALTVKGSGGFMPSSVFQWFMLILIILAIVIVARMISKSYSQGAHGAPAH